MQKDTIFSIRASSMAPRKFQSRRIFEMTIRKNNNQEQKMFRNTSNRLRKPNRKATKGADGGRQSRQSIIESLPAMTFNTIKATHSFSKRPILVV